MNSCNNEYIIRSLALFYCVGGSCLYMLVANDAQRRYLEWAKVSEFRYGTLPDIGLDINERPKRDSTESVSLIINDS